MFIIAGLGNPDDKYRGTRHNVGFQVIDCLAERYGIAVTSRRHRAFVGTGMIGGRKVILAKPQTYMNLSGESIRSLTDYYGVSPQEDLLVIHDDISLDVGQLRIRRKGSAGGHNGLKSIIAHLGTDGFARIKVGVGDRPEGGDLVRHVLGQFSKGERERIEEACGRAAEAAALIAAGEIDRAMNEYNKKREPDPGKDADRS